MAILTTSALLKIIPQTWKVLLYAYKALSKRESVQVARAIEATVQLHSDAHPDLRTVLGRFAQGWNKARLYAAAKTATPDFKSLADSLIVAGGLFYGTDTETAKVARSVVASLVSALQRELLRSERAFEVTEELAQSRHLELLTELRTTTTLSVDRHVTQFERTVARLDEIAKDKPPAEALALWEVVELQLGYTDVQPSIRALVLARVGGYLWQLGRLDKAREKYNEAYWTSPNERRTIIGRALAVGSTDPAAAIALLEPLSRSDDHVAIIGALGQAYIWAGRYEDVIALVRQQPSERHTEPDLLRLHSHALLKLGRSSEAEAIAELLTPKPDALGSDLRFHAICVISGIQEAHKAGREVPQTRFVRATTLLERAIASLRSQGAQRELAYCLIDSAMLLTVERRHAEALARIDEAQRLAVDEPEIVAAVVRTHLTAGNLDKAIAAALSSGKLADPAVAQLLLEAVAAKADKTALIQATSALSSYWPVVNPASLPEELLESYAQAVAASDSEASRLLLRTLEERQAIPSGGNLILRAVLAFACGENDNAKKALSTALHLENETPLFLLWKAADLAKRLQDSSLVVAAYEAQRINSESIEFQIIGYLQALADCADAESEQKALALLETLPRNGPYLRARAHFAERRNDLASALEFCEELEKQTPQTAELTLQIATFLYRLGRKGEAEEKARSIEPTLSHSVQAVRAAHLLGFLGHHQEAISRAYDALSKAPDDFETQKAYVAAFHFNEHTARTWLEREHAQNDDVVRLESHEEGEIGFHLTGRTPFPELKASPSGSSTFANLFGKKEGDDVELSSGTKFHVRAVISKQVYAFQRSFLALAQKKGSGVEQLRFTPDDTSAVAEKLTARRAAATETIDLLRATPMPLFAASELLGVDYLSAFDAIRTTFGGIRLPQEVLDAGVTRAEKINSAPGLVPDLSSLLGLQLLDQLRVLERFQLHISQATADAVADTLNTRKLTLERGQGTLYADERGHVKFAPRDLEQDKQAYEHTRMLADFISARSRLFGRPRGLRPDEERLVPVVGEHLVHSAIRAETLQLPLLTDDGVSAMLLSGLFKIQIVTSVDVISAEYQRDAIDAETYAKLLGRFAARGYRPVPLPARALTILAQGASTTQEYLQAMRHLSDGAYTLAYVVATVGMHIADLIRTTLIWDAVQMRVHSGLEEVRRNRGLAVVAEIVSAAEARFRVRTPTAERAFEGLRGWVEGQRS